MPTMNLTKYAELQGISTKTAQRWFKNGTLRHPAQKVGRLILVDVPDAPADIASPSHGQSRGKRSAPTHTVLYLTASSSSSDLQEWAFERGVRIDEMCRDNGSATALQRLLADPAVTRIVTDSHPAADLLSSALSAQGREFITVTPDTAVESDA